MKTRTILSLALMLTLTPACSEPAEREEGPENEAAEEVEEHESAQESMVQLPVALMVRAKVTVETALATALARVPGGALAAGEMEEEDGKLIYSFDIRVDSQEGIEEVHVDALTGAVIAQEHEGTEQEAAEAREEREG